MTFDLAMLMRKDHHESSDIQTISDLNRPTREYQYGAVAGGSTYNFIQRNHIYTYGQLSVADRAGTLPRSVEEGVQRVRESTESQPYILIGEQYMLEYHASQSPCDLVVVKGDATVMEGEYHLAVKRGVDQHMVNMLEGALGQVKESGRLDELYNKWWKERSQCNAAPETEGSGEFEGEGAWWRTRN